MGGATENIPNGGWPHFGLSPRGRGNLCGVVWQALLRRSIPAWAGQPPRRGTPRSAVAVYPRVGGATAWDVIDTANEIGLSPRGRGNLGCDR